MHPSTCCGISADNGCCCATQARCACGKERALQCQCGDNSVSGPRCSCKSCTCERMGVVDTAIEALEADFTTHKLGAPAFNIFHRRNEKYGAA
ncbi:hypothetical protein VTN02DRAFT_5691 [Thermoascus thermophilus]